MNKLAKPRARRALCVKLKTNTLIELVTKGLLPEELAVLKPRISFALEDREALVGEPELMGHH